MRNVYALPVKHVRKSRNLPLSFGQIIWKTYPAYFYLKPYIQALTGIFLMFSKNCLTNP